MPNKTSFFYTMKITEITRENINWINEQRNLLNIGSLALPDYKYVKINLYGVVNNLYNQYEIVSFEEFKNEISNIKY